jgi:hypothetical protein
MDQYLSDEQLFQWGRRGLNGYHVQDVVGSPQRGLTSPIHSGDTETGIDSLQRSRHVLRNTPELPFGMSYVVVKLRVHMPSRFIDVVCAYFPAKCSDCRSERRVEASSHFQRVRSERSSSLRCRRWYRCDLENQVGMHESSLIR